MNFDVNQVGDFKKVIDEIITAKLQSYGITSYIAAKVTGVNNDGTVNVSIPPDDNRYVNNVLNKSNEILSVGDSVELCTKNGKLSNAWVALKHGASTSSGGGNYILDDLPIGAQFAYSNANEIPLGCLVCDGSAVSRTDYSELFAVIGTTYGAGDGSTTFNLPDKRGRVSVGLDTAQDEFNAIGKHIGEKKHTLTIDEIPSHSHRGRYLTNSNISTAYNVGYRVSPSAENPTDFNDYVGGSQSHNNIQPSEVDIWLIKAKQKATNVLPDAIIYNGLDSISTTDALSANMGRVLNEKIENISVDTAWDDITGKPNFATVATSGNYNDLSNKPNLSTVATSGSYNDLSNKPSIPRVPSRMTVTRLRSSTSYNTSNATLTNAMNYDLILMLGKVATSNSGYNTALVPTAMIGSSDLKIYINDDANYVAGTFKESGNNVLFRHSGRSSNGYIQYIYGITI